MPSSRLDARDLLLSLVAAGGLGAQGYDAGSAMAMADKPKGRLRIYYGTADNNVHPNNSMQLIQSLQRAGKSFEVQVGPDLGHTALRPDRMMEFFIENLELRAPVTTQ